MSLMGNNVFIDEIQKVKLKSFWVRLASSYEEIRSQEKKAM
jgi:hypothetical protein